MNEVEGSHLPTEQPQPPGSREYKFKVDIEVDQNMIKQNVVTLGELVYGQAENEPLVFRISLKNGQIVDPSDEESINQARPLMPVRATISKHGGVRMIMPDSLRYERQAYEMTAIVEMTLHDSVNTYNKFQTEND